MIDFKSFCLVEAAPPGKKAEEWIKSNKERFKKEYGERWEEVLFATAWKLFGKKEQIEESDAPTTTTVGVDIPDAKPLFRKSKFAGVDCIEVDEDTFHKCGFGKKPYARWSGYVEDENLRSFVQKNFSSSKQLLVMNSKSGSMKFLKR